MPGTQSQAKAASMQPLGTIKNKKGHHLNTPPLWETSRAQHCQAGRYSWAKLFMPKVIIDWKNARHQCDDNEEVLTEVIQDFMAEADSAIVAFERAMKSNSFLSIEQEAHKIKGTASYLHCPELIVASLQLQEKGHEGASGTGNTPKLWKDVEKLYDNFVIALREFRSEVSSKGYK